MTLNFAPGKSEAVVVHRGPGSTEAKIALHASGFQCIVRATHDVDIVVRFVTLYVF